MNKVFLFLLLSTTSFGQVLTPNQMSFSYTVPVNTNDLTANDPLSSAGIYDAAGNLVRTVWSGKRETSGNLPKQGFWDGKDDSGNQMPAGTYTPKVLVNNVTYTWDGPIGNTSNSWDQNTDNWTQFGNQNFNIPNRFVITGSTAWGISGYAELQYEMFYFDRNNPNSPHVLNPNFLNNYITLADIATDDLNLYMINQVQGSQGQNWTTKFDAISGNPGAFTNGTSLVGISGIQVPSPTQGYNNTTLSLIDQSAPNTQVPTSVAVQKGGNILAVGHGASPQNTPANSSPDVVRFFDKNTGSAVGSNLTITNPQSMAFSSAGLWVISNGTLKLVTDPSGANSVSSPITGLSYPVAVAVNRSNNHVYVLDGGTSQQLKEYDASNTLVRTYGDAGGYTGCNVQITNTKLNIDLKADTGTAGENGSWLTVENNGDVWIFDFGTASRILHVTPNGSTFNYVNRILYAPNVYLATVNHINSSRIFIGMVEYSRDYSKTIQTGDPDPALGGNGSWAMVNNWAVCNPLPTTPSYRSVILTAETLSNGRTYAQVNGYSNNNAYMTEMPSDGTPLRLTGQISASQLPVMMRDGSLRRPSATGTDPNVVYGVSSQALTGFDGSNNPQWAAATIIASVNSNTTTQPNLIRGNSSQYYTWPTVGGVYNIYQAIEIPGSAYLGAPHLGGFVAGNSTYIWNTYRSQCMHFPDMTGGFPSGDNIGANTCPGSNGFGGHSGVNTYGEGHYLYSIYDGQYATWGNKMDQWSEDGLFVGEFTQTSPGGARIIGATPPVISAGTAANFLTSPVATGMDGDTYLWLATESSFTPLEEWHIGNLSSVHEYAGSGPLGTSVILTQVY